MVSQPHIRIGFGNDGVNLQSSVRNPHVRITSITDPAFVFQASGVTIADECKQQFESIKRDKKARLVSSLSYST